MAATKCRECDYCKNHGRADNKFSCRSDLFGRKEYCCDHPDAMECVKTVNGMYGHTFIDFGDVSLDSPIQIKTSPWWCPRKASIKVEQ